MFCGNATILRREDAVALVDDPGGLPLDVAKKAGQMKFFVYGATGQHGVDFDLFIT